MPRREVRLAAIGLGRTRRGCRQDGGALAQVRDQIRFCGAVAPPIEGAPPGRERVDAAFNRELPDAEPIEREAAGEAIVDERLQANVGPRRCARRSIEHASGHDVVAVTNQVRFDAKLVAEHAFDGIGAAEEPGRHVLHEHSRRRGSHRVSRPDVGLFQLAGHVSPDFSFTSADGTTQGWSVTVQSIL